MSEWITSTMDSLGYWGVALLMFLENVFPPIPSEVVMPAAGFAAGRGEYSFWIVTAAGSVGSIAGAVGWYLVGRWFGVERVRRWVERRGKWLTLSTRDVDRADRWFDRHGRWAVLVGRLVPGVRTLISLPAGFAEMKPAPFLVYTTVGTVGWTLLLAWLGWEMGDRYEAVGKYVSWIGLAVMAGLVTWCVVWVVRRRRERG